LLSNLIREDSDLSLSFLLYMNHYILHI